MTAGARPEVRGPAPTTAGIRAARPPKPGVDPGRAIGHRWEVERGLTRPRRRALTVFLAGAECPFTCLFCDLWMHTLDGATPPGALPSQLAEAIREAGAPGPSASDDGPALKLYNASNFFDARAVPEEDDERLARLCDGFARVTVETHPRLIGERCERFAERLSGRLEIAMGLETVHPDVFPRLNKGMALEHFEKAVEWARARGIGTRAFILVGLPWVPADQFAGWAVRSVRRAAELEVDRASLIPLRTGNGALDRLAETGELEPVRLGHLESALDDSLEAAAPVRGLRRTVVEADLWDADRFADCDACAGARIERMRAANLGQTRPAPVRCGCGGEDAGR